MLGAALLARYETVLRPEALRWDGWYEGQMGKVRDGLALQEQNTAALAQRVDIGTITIGCALGYLDFRYPDYDWRAGFPPWPRGSPRSTSARPCRPRCRTPERDAPLLGRAARTGDSAGPRAGRPPGTAPIGPPLGPGASQGFSHAPSKDRP